MPDLEELRSRLEAIADELADAALDRLREAAATGGDAAEERAITRARRAVERAVHLLQASDAKAAPEEFFD
ncbi:MAG TPA: hypothetical protein VMU63_07625 [Acidimicrobiales bacterium]|nr:hypothetical protein [Acidimicrobiales bacterium]